jgi:IclR family transcriptional regulator, acetate operon repressor
MRAKNAGRAVSANNSRYLVPVVRSTFRILEELSSSGSLNLNEVTVSTGVPKSTVFRILSTLHHLGYVVRDEAKRTYAISPNLADLANDTASAEALRHAALPYMLSLRDEFGETVNLGRLHLDKVVYLEVVPSEYALRLNERPGASVWAHASAMGKCILADAPLDVVAAILDHRKLPALTPHTITDAEEFRHELRRVKERGYAFDREETTLLATCVAAPIRDAPGRAVAGMSISGPCSRFNPRRDKRAVAGLLRAVAAISQQCSRRPEFSPSHSKTTVSS